MKPIYLLLFLLPSMSVAQTYLYRDCVNWVYVDVESLADSIPLEVLCEDAIVKPAKDRHNWFGIYPKGKECVLKVRRAGGRNIIKQMSFNIIHVPLPLITFFVNGKQTLASAQIQRSSKIHIRLIIDKKFAQACPRDAHYRLKDIHLVMMGGMGNQQLIQEIPYADVDQNGYVSVPIPIKARQAPSGTKFYLEFRSIYRRNGLGEWMLVSQRLHPIERTLSLIVE